MRESSGRRESSKRPVSSCESSRTRPWKRRPRLSTSTMSPGAMPLEVVRRVEGADGSSASREGWWVSSVMGRRLETLGGGADGLPDAGVEVDVLTAVGADADDRGAVGGQGGGQRRAEGLDVGGALPADPVERGRVGEVEPVGRRDVLHEVLALGGRRQE